MTRRICLDKILPFFLTLIYIVGQPTGVCCRAVNSEMTAETSSSDTALCYDASKKHHIRLWSDRAPGAVTDDPCKDIPFLRLFEPNDSAPRTDVGIIVMPGGGYDRLTDLKEQAPVARYFANTLGT